MSLLILIFISIMTQLLTFTVFQKFVFKIGDIVDKIKTDVDSLLLV